MSKTKNKKLFLVESGAKAKKISTFLPINHIVLASYGHIIDLMKKQLAIDVDNNFKPKYKIVQDESNLRIVSKIVEQFKYCDEVIFAADADREGEAIAWHLHRLLYKTFPIEIRNLNNKLIGLNVLSPNYHKKKSKIILQIKQC